MVDWKIVDSIERGFSKFDDEILCFYFNFGVCSFDCHCSYKYYDMEQNLSCQIKGRKDI